MGSFDVEGYRYGYLGFAILPACALAILPLEGFLTYNDIPPLKIKRDTDAGIQIGTGDNEGGGYMAQRCIRCIQLKELIPNLNIYRPPPYAC